MSELYELPDGWEWKRLEDIIRIGCERGFKPTIVDGKVPFIGMTNIDKYTGRYTKYILEDNDKVSKGKTKFQKNAILLGKITPCTQNNKTTIIPNDIDGGYATTEVYALHCLEKITPLYFNYYIRSKQVNEFLVNSMVGATGRQRVPSEVVKNLNIPLPPLQEQKRIVSKLDTLFEKIDKAIALHQQNMDEADVFMGSVLNDVFGELKEKYESTKMKDVVKKEKTSIKRGPFGSALKKSFFVESGYLIYEQYHALNNDFSMERYFIDEEKFNELKGFEVKSGDIIISCSGVYLGKLAIIPENHTKGIINQALLKLTLDKEIIINKLFVYFWNNLINNGFFNKVKKGAAIPNMPPVKELKEIDIPVPPLQLQQKTVAYLDEISQKIKKIKSVQKEKMESLVALKASILDQAFRGEL